MVVCLVFCNTLSELEDLSSYRAEKDAFNFKKIFFRSAAWEVLNPALIFFKMKYKTFFYKVLL